MFGGFTIFMHAIIIDITRSLSLLYTTASEGSVRGTMDPPKDEVRLEYLHTLIVLRREVVLSQSFLYQEDPL